MRMASMRKSDEVLRRKQSNKEAMASKRKRNVSVEHAILSFHHDIKSGPDFVCTSCHHMMYRKSCSVTFILERLFLMMKCSRKIMKS